MLEHVSEFKYFGCVLDKSDTDGAEHSKKVMKERMVAGVIRSLIDARDLQLKCARNIACTCSYIWRERSRIRAVQMDNLKGLLGIMIRELCGVMKRVDKRIDESILWWFSHVERIG